MKVSDLPSGYLYWTDQDGNPREGLEWVDWTNMALAVRTTQDSDRFREKLDRWARAMIQEGYDPAFVHRRRYKALRALQGLVPPALLKEVDDGRDEGDG